MSKYEKGKIVNAKVTGIETYGIFVKLDDNYNGLIHISEMSYGYVKNTQNYAKVGDSINVKIIDVDEKNNHLKLSIKDISNKNQNSTNKKNIEETVHGFKTLSHKLPVWIQKAEKKYKNIQNSIDN